MKRLQSPAAWLGPTLVGSVLGFWISTLFFGLGWSDEPLFGLLARATVHGLGLGLAFLVVDLGLVARGTRALPEGKLAWGMALAGGTIAEVFWILPSWEPTPSVLVGIAKLLVTAVTVRMIFGRTR